MKSSTISDIIEKKKHKYAPIKIHNIGHIFYAARINRNLTLENIAQALNLSIRTVSCYESGVCLPKKPSMDRLVSFYHSFSEATQQSSNDIDELNKLYLKEKDYTHNPQGDKLLPLKDALKNARIDKSLSTVELSNKFNISTAMVSFIESGKRQISLDILLKYFTSGILASDKDTISDYKEMWINTHSGLAHNTHHSNLALGQKFDRAVSGLLTEEAQPSRA